MMRFNKVNYFLLLKLTFNPNKFISPPHNLHPSFDRGTILYQKGWKKIKENSAATAAN